MEIFLYFWYNNSVEHLWTVAYLNMLLCFQSKASFKWLFWLFILIYQSPARHVTASTTHYHGKCVLIYKSSDFHYWNFHTQFWCTGVLNSKKRNIEKHLILSHISQNISYLFNRDLNRDCLVYMFSLRFSGSKFLLNLRRQFRVRKFFSCT